MIALTADETLAVGGRRRRTSRGEGRLGRLERALSDDVAREGGFVVRVSEGCGSVEVRVRSGAACLRLSFDRADLQPARVRQEVRRAVGLYRSALAAASGHSEKETASC